MIHSHSLIFSDFDTDWYAHWAKQLKQDSRHLEGHQLHANKFWQNAVMVQALEERGLIKSGRRGIGFGVGRERLPALFAKRGVKVTATDQDFRTEKAKHWQEHELATGAQSLNGLGICPPKIFHENVQYESLDMTKIPKKLVGKYDFVWSNCALGHLGSIEAGIQFILDSAECLGLDGIAVHTTEINVIDNVLTVDHNKDTVIFRPCDIYELSLRLLDAGYEIDPLHLRFGTSARDQRVSVSPEFGNDFSKLFVGGHLITQVVLIIKKSPDISPFKKKLLKRKYWLAYKNNRLQQKIFNSTNKFLKTIRAYEQINLDENMIEPVTPSVKINLRNEPKDIYLEYRNNTTYPIFGMHDRLHSTKPIALATAGPNDRKSKFIGDDWHNGLANRPSIHLVEKDNKGTWKKLDYVKPKSTFAYRVRLNPAKVKKDTYEEPFIIVQEGNKHLLNTTVTITIKKS